MPIIRTQNLDRRNGASCFLDKFRKDVYSQNGEDGIIQEIFRIIGAESSWCVEFGAWDGIHLSNTRHLIKDCGWSGVLIEGNPARFAKLVDNYQGFSNAIPIRQIIGFERGENTVDDCLRKTPIPMSFDFISIDIDGGDYFVWQSLVRYRPRAVAIEFNPTVPNDVVFVQDKDLAIHQGCSLAALIELGKRKKYELVAVTACNALFVSRELFAKFQIPDNSIDAMRANVIGRIFHGFDGTIYNQMLPLFWTGNGIRPSKDQFQVLSPEERIYEDAVEDTIGKDPKGGLSSDTTADDGPALILFAGQSNMLGHAKAVDGDKPVNPRVFAWNNAGENGEWEVARLGNVPFNISPGCPNSPALHFAAELNTCTGRDVYLIGWPVNASTLSSWADAGAPNMAQLLGQLEYALASRRLRNLKISKVDTILWHQGESDDTAAEMVKAPKLATLSAYREGFAQMLDSLATRAWWAPQTKVIAGELVAEGWLSARNDFYADRSQWSMFRNYGVATSRGLAHVGDRAHFTGTALSKMGKRMFSIWRRLDRETRDQETARTTEQPQTRGSNS